MVWFQIKYGIAVIYVGLLASALDHHNTHLWGPPVFLGALIVAAAYVAKRLKRWHYFPLQCNTMMFIGFVFLAGADLSRNMTPASLVCGVGLLALSSLVLFISNDTFQQEPENLDELLKTDDSSESFRTHQL